MGDLLGKVLPHPPLLQRLLTLSNPHDGVPFIGNAAFSGKYSCCRGRKAHLPPRPSSIYSIIYPTPLPSPFLKTKGTFPETEKVLFIRTPLQQGFDKVKVFGRLEGREGRLPPSWGFERPSALQSLSLFLHAASKGLVEHDKVLLAGDAGTR